MPGDYDHDGTTELAVFRPSNGTWYIHGGITASYGATGDIPVPADFDGDGDTDLAVYRPSNGTWYVNGAAPVVYGTATDTPLTVDLDGNGLADIAVYREGTPSQWLVRGSDTVTPWGTVGDIPLGLPYAIYQST